MLLWKIYFFFIAIVSLPLYLISVVFGPSFEAGIDLGFFIALMVGFFGFAWRKRILNNSFWKIFFPLCAIWNLGYSYYTLDGLYPLVIIAIYIPTLIPLYLYAFKSDEIWNKSSAQ